MLTWTEFFVYVRKREAMGIVFCYGPSCYREFVPCDPAPKTLICDRCGGRVELPARVGEAKGKGE